MHLLTAERLARHFLEKGGPGIFTKPFDRQARLIRTRLTPLLSLKECESAAIAYFIHEHCWVVLTTQRLVWKEGVEGGDLGLDQIRSVQLDMYDFLRKGRTNMDTLYVVRKSEQTHRFRLESGPPFWGFYSALRMAAGSAESYRFGPLDGDASKT